MINKLIALPSINVINGKQLTKTDIVCLINKCKVIVACIKKIGDNIIPYENIKQ